MSQIVQVGFVVNIDYAGHMDLAQVRIPSLHGVPTSFIGNIDIQNNPYKSRIKEYCNYLVDESNSQFTVDDDLPWYPICYPFGSKLGPVAGDIVYVLMENTNSLNGIIIGWAGNQITYNNIVGSMKDKASETDTIADDVVAAFFGNAEKFFS